MTREALERLLLTACVDAQSRNLRGPDLVRYVQTLARAWADPQPGERVMCSNRIVWDKPKP